MSTLKKVGLLKEKDKKLDGSDIREGFTAVISVRVPEAKLQFEGQTKSKLGTAEARSAVDAIISEKLSYYLEENPSVATTLIKKNQLKLHKHAKQPEKPEKMREMARKINVKTFC